MKSDLETLAPTNSKQLPTYYLMLGDLAAVETQTTDVNSDELNEIEQIGRLVLEVASDPPVFMTST